MTRREAQRKLEAATRRRDSAETEWLEAIKAASAAGLSYREIGPIAGVSYGRIAQLLKEAT